MVEVWVEVWVSDTKRIVVGDGWMEWINVRIIVWMDGFTLRVQRELFVAVRGIFVKRQCDVFSKCEGCKRVHL